MDINEHELCILSWIFRLSYINIYEVDNNHICTPKIEPYIDKRGEIHYINKNSIEKHSYKFDFYGCTICGKYHICEKNIKKCPIIKRDDTHICFFSGYTVSYMEYADVFSDVNNFLKESTYFDSENKIKLRKNNQKQKNEKINCTDIESNSTPSNNENTDINLNYKMVVNFSNCLDSIINQNSTNKGCSMEINDQTKPLICEFKPILNNYFSYLKDIISEKSNNLKQYFKPQNIKYNPINNKLNINQVLIMNNVFYTKYEQNVYKEIDNIIDDTEYNERIFNNTYINNDISYSSFNIREYYKPIILKMICIIYNSNYMKTEIFKHLNHKYVNSDLNNTRSEIEVELVAAIKILDYKKICKSLLLDLFLKKYIIKDLQGYNIMIWCEDNRLILRKNHENTLYIKNKKHKPIFSNIESYRNISKSIKNCLIDYNNNPMLLRSKIFS